MNLKFTLNDFYLEPHGRKSLRARKSSTRIHVSICTDFFLLHENTTKTAKNEATKMFSNKKWRNEREKTN